MLEPQNRFRHTNISISRSCTHPHQRYLPNLVLVAHFGNLTTYRTIQSELLDGLPATDARAIRSRRDLKLINLLMGNFRWQRGAIRKHMQAAELGVVEIGAGDGTLLNQLVNSFKRVPLAGLDLIGRPGSLHYDINWVTGDLTKSLGRLSGGVLIGNLILHHFHPADLEIIGRYCERFRVVAFSESLRSRKGHFWGLFLHPFVNDVTRHDLHRSVDAGFVPGELPLQLGLDSDDWDIAESSTILGGYRLIAHKRI